MHDAITGNCQATIAFAVALEGGTRAVCRVAIELDDDFLDRPETVGPIAADLQVDPSVELRSRELAAIEEGDEASLELLAGDACREVTQAAQALTDGAGTVTMGIASKEVIK